MATASEERKVFCEKCESPMRCMGSSFTQRKKLNAWDKNEATRRDFLIFHCDKCHLYKDVPNGGYHG